MELSQGESLIWEGRPSWRAMLAYYVKWGVLALLPAIVVAILNARLRHRPAARAGDPVTAILLVLVLGIGWLLRIGTYYKITTTAS